MKNIIALIIITGSLIAQQKYDIEGEEFMPLHTKLFWGEKGLIRKLNLAPKSRKDELKLRVKMLQAHQRLALASLGLVAYQSNLGNKLISGDYSQLEKHKNFSRISWSVYMTSATLSYLAPPSLKYEKKVSSMKLHRWLSYVHFSGMMAIPFLGINIASSSNYDKAVKLHQNAAYITMFSLALSGLLTILPY